MMIWHTAPEIVSSLVVGVLLLSSGNIRLRLTKKERVFQHTLIVTLCVLAYNVIVDVFVQSAPVDQLWIYTLLYTVLYLIYPMALNFLLWYLILFIGEKTPSTHKVKQKIVTAVHAGLYALYCIIVLLNLKTGWVFTVDEGGIYVREVLNTLPFILAFSQIIVVTSHFLAEKSYVDRITFYLFRWLPLVSLFILVLQLILPDIFLAGTAISTALLSIYLTFQTRKISIDDLTQLPNRGYFISSLSRAVRKKEVLSIVVISLDDFKTINDTFSVRKGDAIILALTSFLLKSFPHAQVHRYSGDEFALSFPQESGNPGEIAQQIMKRMKEPWVVDGISASLRYTSLEMTFPCSGNIEEKPLTILDYALLIAKTQHKGKHLVFNNTILEEIRARRTIISRLHESLEEESLRVVFQPIVELSKGTLVMYEALLRMNDNNLIDISPGSFIPIAEEIGIIDQLTLYVVHRVCAIQSELMRDDKEVPAIAINFSASHFSNRELIRDIQGIIARHRIPKGKLFFEVTEHTFSALPFEEIIKTMNSFLSYGVQFNLDDFGTGYSNLAHIFNLPFKFIKIDKSLLWQEPAGASSSQILKSMASLLQEMGFDIIIEGVETKEQAETLRSIEFPNAQGFYFSIPLEYEEFSRTYTGSTHFPLD